MLRFQYHSCPDVHSGSALRHYKRGCPGSQKCWKLWPFSEGWRGCTALSRATSGSTEIGQSGPKIPPRLHLLLPHSPSCMQKCFPEFEQNWRRKKFQLQDHACAPPLALLILWLDYLDVPNLEEKLRRKWQLLFFYFNLWKMQTYTQFFKSINKSNMLSGTWQSSAISSTVKKRITLYFFSWQIPFH